MILNQLRDEVMEGLRFSFSRSGGAGGQNVNKVNTRVTARLSLSLLHSLSPQQLFRVRMRLSGRLNDADEIVIHVDDERSQYRNREIAQRRMVELIAAAAAGRKRRRPTAPSAAAREVRLQNKRFNGKKKQARSTPREDD